MAPQEKLRERIAEIIQRRLNVDFEEVVWVMDQLGFVGRTTKHGVIFKMEGCLPLMLNKHNNGKKKLPGYCIDDFRDRMIELELYAQDGSYEDA
jgi:hypothetical protein